jgi:hypothetical protein
MGIGTLGNIQNILAAGKTRKPSALGLHIQLKETITGSSVAATLKEMESKYPLVGTSLVPVFFPGSMRVPESELGFWHEAMNRRMAPNKHGVRIDTLDSAMGQFTADGVKS